ncbi:DUF3098 domain-containing protein [Flavobacterium sp. Sd200]|uniref:DUF3098 domain-containing protein n=1 Tax=Flavobacterium sp. Sd200 TaxID=2692211 RepID=UPI00136FF42A|nr:DUF3098 domain-containing protein [Flavobacterium sp. Sd200]MXN92123.1 DUF3098 domain-containing protein [Flavobacterium sp. Sd200]
MENNSLKTQFLFEKVNYKILLIGIAVIALGFILMSGGGSDDPNVFSDAIFNFQRIRLAPTVVLIGFGVTIYAILKNPGTVVTTETFPEDKEIKNFKNKK